MPRFFLILGLEIVVLTLVSVRLVRHAGPWSVALALVVGVGGIMLIAATAFHLLWRPMLADFPSREPAPDAVRRRFQSFGLGIVNMGCSIHVAADDELQTPRQRRLAFLGITGQVFEQTTVGVGRTAGEVAGEGRPEGVELGLVTFQSFLER